jgi:hypothetical protein
VGKRRRTPRTDRDPTTNQRRLTVHDAARRLGISEDAVRMRVKRGTLDADREGGRLYVLLEPDPTVDLTDRTDELIDELRDRVQSLEDQLEAERQAHAEARRIVAGLVERIPALEPPESPGTPSEPVQRGAVPPEAEPGTERVPWWRRWFQSL